MPFSWDDLRFFLAVARAGRLTLAAQRLGVDHATVSRRVQALEAALKATFFNRSPKGYALTPHGERLLEIAEAMETAALTAQSDVSNANLSLSGAVRIGAPDGFGTFFLASRLAQFCETYPDLDVQLVAMPRSFSLSKREADIAISLTRPEQGRVYARKLTDYSLSLYASKTYLARHSTIANAADLRNHRIIGYIQDLIFTPELDYLRHLGKGLKAQITSTNLVAQRNATLAAAGLCILPDFMVNEDSRLSRVLPDEMRLTRSFWLVVHAEMRELARIRAIIDYINQQVKLSRHIFMP